MCRDIERRCRLICDQKPWIVGKRHGDHNPLPLATGELEGIRAHEPGRVGQADLVEQFQDAVGNGRARKMSGVDPDRFADLLACFLQRVERGQGLLKDHRDIAAAQGPQAAGVEREQIGPVKVDVAVCRRDFGWQQPEDRVGDHRLSGPAFADQANDLVFGDGETHVVDRAIPVGALRQGNRQSGNRQQTHDLEILGFSASFRASPARLIATTVVRIAMPGKTLIHHAWRITVRPAPIM